MTNILIKASSRYPIRRKLIKATIAQVLTDKKISSDVEVEINIIGDRKMTQLNEQYLNKPGTTDVISFPLNEKINQAQQDPDEVLRLGTIFISYPKAQKQANTYRRLVDEEINRLVEHGMLHLLGIHHK